MRQHTAPEVIATMVHAPPLQQIEVLHHLLAPIAIPPTLLSQMRVVLALHDEIAVPALEYGGSTPVLEGHLRPHLTVGLACVGVEGYELDVTTAEARRPRVRGRRDGAAVAAALGPVARSRLADH